MAGLLRTAAAALADYFGRPVAPRTLSERQTEGASTQALARTWAGHPVRGITPERMAGLLEAAEAGDLTQQSELYLDMEERDPHLHAEMAKRRRAILSIPWSIEPPRNPSAREKRQAAAVADLLGGIPDLEDVLLDLMDAVGHGFSCLEITWSGPGAERLPGHIEHRPQTWFQLDKGTRTQLRLRDQSSDGAELWPYGWITHTHRARSGYLARSGLYRILTWPWIMRQFSLRDMAEWLEIYGLPMRLGYYPSGAGPTEKATLFRAVRDLGRHAAGIMPEGMRIDLLAAAEGQAEPFLAMVQYADAVMSRAILGGSLSSTPAATGMGSGVADLQGDVKRDLLVSDARQVQSTLGRDLLYPLAALNGLVDDPRRAPVWRFDTREPTDLTAFSTSLQRLTSSGMGAYIPVSWVRTQTGIPEPTGDEPTLGASVAAPGALDAGAAPEIGAGAVIAPGDLNSFGLGMQNLSALLQIPEAWVRAQTGIPSPAAGEPVLQSTTAAPGAAIPVQAAALAALRDLAGRVPSMAEWPPTHPASVAWQDRYRDDPAEQALLRDPGTRLAAAVRRGADLSAGVATMCALYPMVEGAGLTALAALATADSPSPPAGPDWPDAHTAALGRSTEPAVLALVDVVRAELDAALAACEDMAAFRARLLTLYPALPREGLVAVLGEGLAAADLAGRYDIDRGA